MRRAGLRRRLVPLACALAVTGCGAVFGEGVEGPVPPDPPAAEEETPELTEQPVERLPPPPRVSVP
ncbi:MAG: hypothetical protein ACRELV_04895, partial [Longimicrobiales bacterium]